MTHGIRIEARDDLRCRRDSSGYARGYSAGVSASGVALNSA